MGLWSKAKSWFSSEGSQRGPFYGEAPSGGWYPLGRLEDGFQRDLSLGGHGARHVPVVYSCVMAIARAMSQCYPKHVRVTDGRFEEVQTSAAYRVLLNPNSYQSSPGFILNLVASALFDGEAFALAMRNDRFEVSELHLLPRGVCSPIIDPDTRDIFYAVGENPLASGGADYIVPARDILHLRFHTPRHPLIGESPIKAAALAIGINVSLSRTQSVFFNNMNRPSGIISTDQVLTREQMTTLRLAFEEQSQGMAAGKIPVLAGGLKFSPMSINSQDAELVEAQRMSVLDIARVFGVPPQLIGELKDATLGNAEALIQAFLSMSLGSYLEHTERAFDRLFGLTGGNEYIELDVSALLRTDFAGRIDGLTKAVQGGLLTPDEARNREGYAPVKGGNTAYLQRQMVPIDKIGDLLDAEAARLAAPPPAPASTDTQGGDGEDAPPAEQRDIDVDVMKALLFTRMQQKRAAA
jgi:HK97 family phage portal protein